MKSNQSVHKAAALLRAAAAAQPDGETASGLARTAELPHPTALRLIRTLEDEGFLMRLPGTALYVLGADLLRLAGGNAAEVLAAAARPVLEDLAKATSETATLSIAHRDSIEVVLQVDGPHMVGLVSWVRERFPLHATSSGKVVLATWTDERVERYLKQPRDALASRTITDPAELREEIARVRELGYALIEDELEDGLTAIGVPVFAGDPPAPGRPARLIGVLNLNGPSFRFDRAAWQRALPLLSDAAHTIALRLNPALDDVPARPQPLRADVA